MPKKISRAQELIKEYGKLLTNIYKLKTKRKYYKAGKLLYLASIIDGELGRPKNRGDIISQIKELERDHKHTFPHQKKEKELKEIVDKFSKIAKEAVKKGDLRTAIRNYEQCAIKSVEIGEFIQALDYTTKFEILKEKEGQRILLGS